MLVRELRVSYETIRPELRFDNRRAVRNPADAVAVVRPLIADSPVEVVGILCLSTPHRLICWHEVSRGILDASLVHPREVFKAAILANASGIVLAHNHPSGDPTPSPEDRALTVRIRQAGEILGIPLLDHVVVGDTRHFSFKEAFQL